MARQLLLVRHARPVNWRPGLFIGATDLPLDDEGRAQAERLGPRVKTRGPACCYCSPLLRCRQTAQALAPELPTVIEEDLREIHFGRWEKRTFAAVAGEDPQRIEQWAAFAPQFAFPEGESLEGFVTRIRRAAARLADQPADTILVVAHGGVIRMMICHFLGLSPRDYVLFEVGHAGLAVIRLFDGRGILTIGESGLRSEDQNRG